MRSATMEAVCASVDRLVAKAMIEYKAMPAGRATMYYRATTAERDGDLIVRHPDDDVELGYETALVISAAWPYDLTRRMMKDSVQRLPILPMAVANG